MSHKKPDSTQTTSPDSQHHLQWFRAAAPYIQSYRNKTFVLALPGEAVASDQLETICHDIALLNSLGIRLVLCFGARPQINNVLKGIGISSAFHHYTRVTPLDAIQPILQVVGEIRHKLEALFFQGLANTPDHRSRIATCSGNFVTAKPIGVIDGIDLQLTGIVRKVQTDSLQALLQTEQIILVPPTGYSTTGETFNLSVYENAAAIASALKADKLILYSESPYLSDEQGRRISALPREQALHKLGNKADSEILHLLQVADSALNNVPRVQLIDYQENGALLKELFTRDGTGTLIYCDHYEQIRPASIEDVGGILELIEPLEKSGAIVKRSRQQLETEISYFRVADRDGMIVACAALYPLADNCAEAACIASHKNYRNSGLGARIVNAIEEQARRDKFHKLFVLTTQAEHFFIERGFINSTADALPKDKKGIYNLQRNSKVFEKKL